MLSREKEICFDTETTHIDANLAELVGMSFSVKPGEGYYVPCPVDRCVLHGSQLTVLAVIRSSAGPRGSRRWSS